MSKTQGSKSFAQKYRLEGTGKSVRVSEKTKDAVNSLYRRSDDMIKR